MQRASVSISAIALKEPKYLKLWKLLKPDYSIEEIARNVPIRQPILWVGE
jgi:hypothetical protein